MVEAEVRFPANMVDRITPATTEADIAEVARLTGHHDAAPVMHQVFCQWAVQDDFVRGVRPDFASAGAQTVETVTALEDMKLRMLNGTHSALAHRGYLAWHGTIADTVADPAFEVYGHQCWDEVRPAVAAAEGVSLTNYADVLFARCADHAIRYPNHQIANDDSQKLPQRLPGTLPANLDANRESPAYCLAVAGWMLYVAGTDKIGQPVDLRETATGDAEGTVKALLALAQIFPPDLAPRPDAPVTQVARRLWSDGARDAAQGIA